MFAAFFITCMMGLDGQTKCAVSHTEMAEHSRSLTECTQAAAALQELAIASILSTEATLTVVRRESGCDIPTIAEQIAVAEYALLRSSGVDVTLSAF